MSNEISILRNILINEFDIKINCEVDETTKLIDLGIDSLGFIAILACFEEKYNINATICTDDLDNIYNLDMKFLASKVKGLLQNKDCIY